MDLSQNLKFLDATKMEVDTKGMNLPSGFYSISNELGVNVCSIGYINLEIKNPSKLVSIINPPELKPVELEKEEIAPVLIEFVVPKLDVNVRIRPIKNSKIIGVAKVKNKYEVIDQVIGWKKIKLDNRRVGWSMVQYLNVFKEDNKDTDEKLIFNLKYAMTENFNVNIRSTSQTLGKIIGVAKRGDKYEILDLSNSFWIKIKFGKDKEGWVVKKYFRILD